MSATASIPVESKSAKKRKAKGETAPPTSGAATPLAEPAPIEPHANGVEGQGDSVYIKELTRNIRNIHKKLAASSKADTVIADNPGVSLDDLVASKKLNTDQKAQILKKPGLQAQVAQLEEQLNGFRAFAQELEEKFAKEKASLVEVHEAEIAAAKEKAIEEAEEVKELAVADGLRVISHFLHAAASKRQSEDVDSDEARAFEGTLLLVYQGNEASLDTLKNLIDGTSEKVPDVAGELLEFTYAQVRESSLQGAQDSIPSAEEVGEIEFAETTIGASDVQTDATVANAGLTELADTTAVQANNDDAAGTEAAPIPEQATTGAEAANAVAESSWDPQASVVTDTSATNEEWVQVPRDPGETETGLTATPADNHGTGNWAEEVGAAASEEKPNAENDGFEQVKQRDRGRGRSGRGGRGDTRGRGRGAGRGGDGHRGGRGGPPRGRGGPRGDKS